MTRTKKYAAFSALALSFLLLTGCGSGIPANKVHKIADLKGKNIGVQSGTTGDTLAGDVEEATVTPYDKAADAIDALVKGEIDAVIVDSETADNFISKNANITTLKEFFAEEQYAIAMKLDNTTLQSEINSALSALDNNGTLRRIKDNYEGDGKGQHPYQIKTDVDRSKGTLIMATNAEFPPYESHQGEMIVGYDIDMMNAVCDYIGYSLQIEDMAFEDVLPAVAEGKADVGVAGLSVTEERQKQVLFSDVYAKTNQVVIVRKK